MCGKQKCILCSEPLVRVVKVYVLTDENPLHEANHSSSTVQSVQERNQGNQPNASWDSPFGQRGEVLWETAHTALKGGGQETWKRSSRIKCQPYSLNSCDSRRLEHPVRPNRAFSFSSRRFFPTHSVSDYAISSADRSSMEPVDPTSLAAAATEIGWGVVPTDYELVVADPMDPKSPILLAYAWNLISIMLENLSVHQTKSLAALREYGPPKSWHEEDLTVSRFRRRFREFKNEKENQDSLSRINNACMMKILGTYSAVIIELGSHLGKFGRPIPEGPCKGLVPTPDKYQQVARRLFIKALRAKTGSSRAHLTTISEKWTKGFTTEASKIFLQRTGEAFPIANARIAAGSWTSVAEDQVEAQSLAMIASDRESLIEHSIANAESLLEQFKDQLSAIAGEDSLPSASSIGYIKDFKLSNDGGQQPVSRDLPFVGPGGDR